MPGFRGLGRCVTSLCPSSQSRFCCAKQPERDAAGNADAAGHCGAVDGGDTPSAVCAGDLIQADAFSGFFALQRLQPECRSRCCPGMQQHHVVLTSVAVHTEMLLCGQRVRSAYGTLSGRNDRKGRLGDMRAQPHAAQTNGVNGLLRDLSLRAQRMQIPDTVCPTLNPVPDQISVKTRFDEQEIPLIFSGPCIGNKAFA